MRKILTLFLLALPLFADEKSITVTGRGSVSVVPDRVSFTVGVFTNAPTVSESFNMNSAKTRRVIEALKAHGVRDAEIQTSTFSINSAMDSKTNRPAGYNVENSVTVTREDPKIVSELIQAAVDAGANRANGVQFFASDERPARARAIERAVEDARVQAEKLAAAAGVNVGHAIKIEREALPGVSGFITMSAESILAQGTVDVSYAVTITYELK